MGLGIIGTVPPAPSHTVHAVLPHTAFPRAVDDPHSAVPPVLASHPSDPCPRPQLKASRRRLGAVPLIPADAGTRAAHPATGALLGPVLLSMPIVAPIACADFRSARDRFAGCAYRPRRLPGAAGWHTCGHLTPVRRRISPVPYSAVQAFRSPYAGGFLGAATPSSSPRPWPSPGFQGLGSLLTPRIPRAVLRRCRIRITLRTACLLDPKRAFVVALRRFGSLLAPATSYTAAWSLLWPDSHRQVEYGFQDARNRERLVLRLRHVQLRFLPAPCGPG